MPRRDGGANPTQRWSRTARRQPVQRRGSSPAGEVTTLSQVPGARDKAERAERAVVAHSNMTSAEAARRSTVLVSEQRLAHAATAAGASARRRSAGTAGPDELEVSCGRSRVQAAQPHRLFLAVRRRRGAQILRSADTERTRSRPQQIDHARPGLLAWICGSDCPPAQNWRKRAVLRGSL